MAVVAGANARNDEGGDVGGVVLLFEDAETVEVKDTGRQLRGARAVFAAKEVVGASTGYGSRKSASGAKLVMPVRRSSRVPSRRQASLAR
jgi:hypothetical protein